MHKRKYINKKGQSALELCVLTACCAAALLAMSGYVIRAMQGTLRDQADELGSQYAPGKTVALSKEETSRASEIQYLMVDYQEFSAITGVPTAELDKDRYYFVNQETITNEETSEFTNEVFDSLEY